jgi:hypothetical protein
MLHFGLDMTEGDPPRYGKTLHNQEGRRSDIMIDPIPWRDEARRVVHMAALAMAIQPHFPGGEAFTSAQFALEMIAGVEKLRCKRGGIVD